jgi:hypothetical protein
LVFGLTVGVLIGSILPKLIYTLTHSLYSRSSLDNIMKNLLGKYKISEALTDELMIVAYEYNS